MKFTAIFLAAAGVSGALAACNCKCQDPSGEGQQWNDYTEKVCGMKLTGEDGPCQLNKGFRPDKANQCSSSFCCIDAGSFDKECKSLGATGAYCWE